MKRLLLLTTATLLGAACSPAPSTTDGGGEPFDAGTQPPADAGSGPTWYRDVLPVVQASCHTCHAEGGVAPFTLLSYDDAIKVRWQMATSVLSGRMPPWLPGENAGCAELQDSPVLSQKDKDTIVQWARGDALAGNPADAPPAPDGGLRGLPRVDATLDFGADYTPPRTGADDYRCFLLDPKLLATCTPDAGVSCDKFIVGMDLVPGQRKMVHHAVIFSAPMAEARAADNASAQVGWPCYGGGGTANTEMVGGWVPGMSATVAPAGTGIRLKAGDALVMQLHYNISNGVAPDRTVVKLQYADSVQKEARLLPLLQNRFQIPPNSSGYAATAQFSLPVDATVYGVAPHMHTLARKLKVEKGSQCLLDIQAWDFNWQRFYWFKTPIQGLQGDIALLTCSWDNPTNRTVRWGEGTADEMCLNFFYVTF